MDTKKVTFDKSKTNNQALLKWLDKMVDMCGPRKFVGAMAQKMNGMNSVD
jgi:hypothetical protein